MQILKYTKLKNNRYKIEFSNDMSVTFYDDIIIKEGLLLKKEITDEELMQLSVQNDSLSAYYSAIKYLGTKMRAKKELENYLKKAKHSEDVIEKTITRIEIEGYLKEDSYINAYINDQINLTNNGPYKIKRNLIELGFNVNDIDENLSQYDDSIWTNKVEKLITKKINAKSNDSSKKIKLKIIENLTNLGYEKQIITDFLENIKIDDNKELIAKEGEKIITKLKRNSKLSAYELKNQVLKKMLQKGFEYDEIMKFLNSK